MHMEHMHIDIIISIATHASFFMAPLLFFRHLISMGVFYHTQPVLSIGFRLFLHRDLFFVENMQYEIAYDAKNVRFDHMIFNLR